MKMLNGVAVLVRSAPAHKPLMSSYGSKERLGNRPGRGQRNRESLVKKQLEGRGFGSASYQDDGGDLLLLTSFVVLLEAFNLFPNTAHVETLAVATR